MKDKQQILEEHGDKCYTLDTLNAMDEYAKKVSIAFAECILNESILPRDSCWFDAGKHFTSEQLYKLYLDKFKPKG